MLKRRSFLTASVAGAAAAALPVSGFGADLAPFKLFDTHAHFYTNEPDQYPFNASRSRYGAERMIAKAMARPMNPAAVFAFWDQVGIEMGTGVQYSSTYQTDNSYLLDVSAEHPDRIIPVVILAPTDPATPDLLRQYANENRLAGVRFTGGANDQGEVAFLSPAADATWTAANELGISIVLMPLGSGTSIVLRKIAEYAERYPNVEIVLDHIGFPRPERLPDTYGLTPEHMALAGHENVYYKYTDFLISEMEAGAAAADTPMVDLKSFLNHMVAVFGAEQFVWGSDFGNVEVDDVAYVQRALDSASDLSPAQQRAFFYDTAKAVFVPGGRGRG